LSYDIRLSDPETGAALTVPNKHNLHGGTYMEGGTNDLWLNVTYNYCNQFLKAFGENGIRTIYGMTGAESVPVLEEAMDRLHGLPSSNYWDSTEGNAKEALGNLYLFAKERPDGVWKGD